MVLSGCATAAMLALAISRQKANTPSEACGNGVDSDGRSGRGGRILRAMRCWSATCWQWIEHREQSAGMIPGENAFAAFPSLGHEICWIDQDVKQQLAASNWQLARKRSKQSAISTQNSASKTGWLGLGTSPGSLLVVCRPGRGSFFL